MKDFDPNRKPRSRKRGSKRFGRDRPRRESKRFDRRDSGRRDDRRRRFDRRDGRSNERHTITCDTCGEKCEVPFKPTPGKPIYCNNCFRSNKGSGSDSRELEKINKKLDRILEALDAD